MTAKTLSVVTVLLFGMIFGVAVGIVTAEVGASPATAIVASASITVTSMGAGFSVVTILSQKSKP